MQLNLDTFKFEKKELLRMLKLSKKVTFKMLVLSGKFQNHKWFYFLIFLQTLVRFFTYRGLIEARNKIQIRKSKKTRCKIKKIKIDLCFKLLNLERKER